MRRIVATVLFLALFPCGMTAREVASVPWNFTNFRRHKEQIWATDLTICEWRRFRLM
jgi:hypothetical protein